MSLDLQIKSMSTSKRRMAESFDDGRVGVFKSSVFADQTDRHFTRQVVRPGRDQHIVKLDSRNILDMRIRRHDSTQEMGQSTLKPVSQHRTSSTLNWLATATSSRHSALKLNNTLEYSSIPQHADIHAAPWNSLFAAELLLAAAIKAVLPVFSMLIYNSRFFMLLFNFCLL